MLTDFQCYRSMAWTTDHDECENGCGVIMAEGRYVEGRGHFCSEECRDANVDYDGPTVDWREDFHADG